jgi:cysteinyl-tRNA synthetase
MSLRIYNTLTRQKEDFETLEPGRVSMYICGPTVYSKAHVGHAMSALVFDIIRRYLEYKGYDVRFIMNYTDVDDKIIQRAQEQARDPFELAEAYIQEFQGNLQALNILPATVNPRATEEIDYIIRMITELGEAGYAYDTNGDVYFRVTRDDDYGKLSKRKLEDMQAGSRISVDERKEHPMDFALWKGAKPGEPAWDSPWGRGRPGWHIECSAMNLHHHGEQIDIHGGGNDLIFPHHENEIAQTESLTGKTFARYWVHNGMMQLGGEKMSKSLGNLVTIEDFLSSNEADVLRIMVLNSSYRNPLTFSQEVVEQSKKALERLRSALRSGIAKDGESSPENEASLARQVQLTRQGFSDSMDDDFNSAGALGHLFDLVRAINQARDAGVSSSALEQAQHTLLSLSSILGMQLERPSTGAGEASPFVDLLVELRTDLRKQKLWSLSDVIRDRLKELGVVIEDTKEGTHWHWE